MIILTKAHSIAEIFSNEASKNRFYTIPKYQRAYTWGQKEWDLLFDDIITNDNGYFLGSFICISRDNAGMASFTTLEVIDGQQRLTTMSLLLAALYKKLLQLKNRMTDEQIFDFIDLKKRLVKEKDKIPTPVLTLQNQNQNCDDYFCILCNELNLLKDKPKIQYYGNRKIYSAYRHFISRIDAEVAERQKEDPELDSIDTYFGFVKKFCSAVMVAIEVGNNKDAYMLFESLNNRGIPLSAMDLIKNYMIAKAEKSGKIDECHEQWLRIIDNLTDDVNIQERFFRQYYNAFRDELKGPTSAKEENGKYRLGAIATRTTLLDLYEKMIDGGLESFLNNLEKESENYSILINNDDATDKKVKNALLNLERIQGTPSYISLLYILSKKEELEITNDVFIKIINFLTKFFVRRNLTDIPATNKLTKIFMELNTSLKSKRGNEVYEEIKRVLISKSAIDSEFEEKLKGPVYDENADVTRFLLCFYEENFNTREHIVDLWSRENKKYIWTIEHIFPEGANIPEYWVDMIAGGDYDKAKKIQNDYVHTLGNLTITGYNSNLGNKAFEEKKNRQKDGKDIGYKNGLKLNEDVVSQEKWTIDNITARTGKLVKEFKKLFDLNNDN